MNYLQPAHASLPPQLPKSAWAELLHTATYAERNSPWWLADLALYAKENYAETADQWAEIKSDIATQTSKAIHTIENYISTARAWAPDSRHQELEFGHHEATAALDPDEREYWMSEATANGWTVSRLRQALRMSPEAQNGHSQAITEQLSTMGLNARVTARSIVFESGLVIYSASPLQYRIEE